MAIKIANNAQGVLAAGIDNASTTMDLNDASDFPTVAASSGEYFYVTLFGSGGVNEIVKVTGVDGNEFTIERGQDGTNAIAHAAGRGLELRINAAVLNDMYHGYSITTDLVDTFGITPDLVTGFGTYNTVTGYHALTAPTSYTGWFYKNDVTGSAVFNSQVLELEPWTVEFDDRDSGGYHNETYFTGQAHYANTATIKTRTNSAFGGGLRGLSIDVKSTATNKTNGDDPDQGSIVALYADNDYRGEADTSWLCGIRSWATASVNTDIHADSVDGIFSKAGLFSNDSSADEMAGITSRITMNGECPEIIGVISSIGGSTQVPADYGDDSDHGRFLFQGEFEYNANVEDTSLDYGIHLTGDKFNKLDGKLGIGVTPTSTSPILEVKGGVEFHWLTNSEGTSPTDVDDAGNTIGVQTKRFHITERGIHIGDDLVGTYTAGDLQNNADKDYGMLVGRSSINLGSNNLGFGYGHEFKSNTASNFAQGSLIKMNGATQNCAAFGGNIEITSPLSSTTGSKNCFAGGSNVEVRGDDNFTWAKGAVTPGGQVYHAENYGQATVLFGKQGLIDTASRYSLLGGEITQVSAGTYRHPELQNADGCINWGLANKVSNSVGSAAFGKFNYVYNANESAVFGYDNDVFAAKSLAAGSENEIKAGATASAAFGGDNEVIGQYSLAAGKAHKTEGNYNVALGNDNNTLGESGVCLGSNLKTPLYQNNSGQYYWLNSQIVVGAYNNPTEKYYTSSDNSTWADDQRLVVGTGTATNAQNGFVVAVPTDDFSGIIMPALAASTAHASMSDAKDAGVPVGGLYRDTNNNIKIVV
jgi:hypothetical protein